MGSHQTFRLLLKWLEESETVNLKLFFAELQKYYQIENILHAVQFTGAQRLQKYALTIHSARHQNEMTSPDAQQFLQQFLADIWRRSAPCDRAIAHSAESPQQRELISALGLGTHAIILPIAAGKGPRTLLSFHFNSTPEIWVADHITLMRDLPVPAALFHERMCQGKSVSADSGPKLTDRESEVLSWVAVGKSYWEISMILGISERTVRFFMSNIRGKLNAVSNKQALAEAALRGLVDGEHPGRPRG